MKSDHKFAGMFFDLGGTLFHHLPVQHTHGNLLRMTGSLPGADEIDEAALITTYHSHRRQVEEEATYQAFFMHRGLVAEAMRRTLHDFGLASKGIPERFCDAQCYCVTRELNLRADTVPTLQRLRDMGLYTAIVSNIDDDYILPLLARSGLTTYFDYCLSSERARSCKPHAGIFRQALAVSGLAPEQVLFVGDSFVNDVTGPRRLGMATALLTIDLGESYPQGADYNITALEQLVDLVSAPNARH